MTAPTRQDLIARLRPLLRDLDDPECSLCLVMTRRRLFCRGFAAWTDAQLREHFPWFCDVRPGVDRSEIEALADRWQLADQTSRGLALPCDLGGEAPPERCGCAGWSRFDDGVLAGFLAELEAEADYGDGPRARA